MPRSDAASRVVKYRNAQEFEVARFRVYRENAAGVSKALKKFKNAFAYANSALRQARNDD